MITFGRPHHRFLWINLALFVPFHVMLVFGLRSRLDTFPGLMAGIVVGLLAYVVWIYQPELWRSPLTALGLLVANFASSAFWEEMNRPPPPPERLEVKRQSDDIWTLNRGEESLRGKAYLALASEDEQGKVPPILGAFRVEQVIDSRTSRVSWEVLRHGYRERTQFRVRALRKGEKMPVPGKYVTVSPLSEPSRAWIDAGTDQFVRLNDTFALFHPTGPGNAGYMVVDHVEPTRAEGYLSGATLSAPADADWVGPLVNVVQLLRLEAEMAFMSGRTDAARTGFEKILQLSRGEDKDATARLATLNGTGEGHASP